MGNAIDSFFSGFFDSIGKLFGSPLDFLSGKSCSSVCESPWDFMCFIEHFCVANLAKMALILILSYFFLLFIYMLYKMGFFHCISHGFCRILWACVSCCFSSCKFCFTCLCSNLLNPNHRRRHRKHPSEYAFYVDDDASLEPPRFGNHRRKERLRKSLRPRSHRVRVAVRKDSSSVHGIRVSSSSRFARKGLKHRPRRIQSRVS